MNRHSPFRRSKFEAFPWQKCDRCSVLLSRWAWYYYNTIKRAQTRNICRTCWQAEKRTESETWATQLQEADWQGKTCPYCDTAAKRDVHGQPRCCGAALHDWQSRWQEEQWRRPNPDGLAAYVVEMKVEAGIE